MARIPALHLSRCVLLVSGLVLALCPVACTAEEHGSDAGGDGETPCELKTVTVSTLPVLRENEFSFTGGGGAGAGVGAGGGGGGAGGSSGGGTGATAGGESRLLLFVRTDIPGRVSVVDDLENTALPYFTLEMSGTVEEISLVHWKQQWLENGTLFFHVTLTESELPPEATPPSAREPAHVHEHMHLLHISVMVNELERKPETLSQTGLPADAEGQTEAEAGTRATLTSCWGQGRRRGCVLNVKTRSERLSEEDSDSDATGGVWL